MNERRLWPWTLLFVFVLTLVRFVNAAWLPPIQDEAYYFYWSRFLDWGYFDHPPLVAWIASLINIWPSSMLAARFGTLVLSLLALPLLISFFRLSGLDSRRSRAIALVLTTANLGGILLGYITTPDIPLIFCWIAALHEASHALVRDPRRWLSAGFFTGLGIMGKYTMVLIGPVFLIALLYHPKKLRQIWPYLGGLVAVLTLLPHIFWLADNDWITLRFQFGRGLKSEYGVAMQMASDLPGAVKAPADGIESRLAQYFKLPEDEIAKPRPKPSGFKRWTQGVGDYIGGQVAIWGFLLIPIGHAFWQRRGKHKQQTASWSHPALRALAWAGALVPLLLFGLISPVQHVETNWPAMYVIGAALCLAHSLRFDPRLLVYAAGANLFLSLLVTGYTYQPFLNKSPHKDRLLKETHGYRDLAASLSRLDHPLFLDTYQNVSQIAFYEPHLLVQQWPGIARTSELLRRPEMNPLPWLLLQTQGSFYLLSDNFIPPHIPGATLSEVSEILDCFQDGIIITRFDADRSYVRPCEKRIHRWTLSQYKIESLQVPSFPAQ